MPDDVAPLLLTRQMRHVLRHAPYAMFYDVTDIDRHRRYYRHSPFAVKYELLL